MEKLVALRLKKLRKLNGYSQKQVSDYLSIDQSNLSKIERGERTLYSSMVEDLRLIYNCSDEYLTGKTEDYKIPKTAFRADGKLI